MSGSLDTSASSGLQINVVYDASVANAPPAFRTTVAAAVAYLESQFLTPITITIDVGYGEVNGTPVDSSLGESSAFESSVDYQTLVSAMDARTSTADEVAAAASLPVIDPTDGGIFFISAAEAEAMGLSPNAGSDPVGAIGISSTAPLTFGTTNGAAPGTYDAFGAIVHEMTEVMGRNELLGADNGSYTLLDLFRYTSPGVRDLVTGPGSFSVDGATMLAQFNNSAANGEDAGDWDSTVTDDSFDAYSQPGVANVLSATDLREMDVLGYTPVPTVSAYVLSFTASPGLGDVPTGSCVTLTVTINSAVTMSGGTPTLSLNDGGSASYSAGQSSGTNLVFSYAPSAGQSTMALAVTGVNLNGTLIRDAAGNVDSFSTTQATLSGLEINVPLIDGLNVSQQLELLYIGYFGHAADGPGLSFWLGQNTVAQAGGQSEAVALAGIANSFMPQAETDVLYPSLASVGVDPATPAAQTELAAFVGDIYENLFDRAADSSGATYWVQQITSGAATLGSVILAIANGAVGTDAIQLQNKITVALDFTTATNAAGLDGTGPASAAFLAAASAVMSGVDGTSLNDTSVTAGENATTAYIAAAEKTSSQTLASGDEPSMLANPIVVSAANIVVDPGAGDHAIQFIGGSGADTIVLHSNATDQIAGFNLAAGDVLDLSSLLAETQVNARDVLSNMNAYVTIVDQGANAALLFDPSGHGGGTAVAMLLNLGATVTNLGVLTSHDAILT